MVARTVGRTLRWCGLALALAGCGGGDTADVPARDSLTQRQRDSVIGASKLPGAQGVRGALSADSAARARGAATDSSP